MCVFCKIINKEIPADIVYESDDILAFKDLHPKAPVHILIIPKKHCETLNDINKNNSNMISQIFEIIPIIAKEQGIDQDGYRIIANCNKNGGQEVFHIHFHLVGGKKLTWPTG